MSVEDPIQTITVINIERLHIHLRESIQKLNARNNIAIYLVSYFALSSAKYQLFKLSDIQTHTTINRFFYIVDQAYQFFSSIRTN